MSILMTGVIAKDNKIIAYRLLDTMTKSLCNIAEKDVIDMINANPTAIKNLRLENGELKGYNGDISRYGVVGENNVVVILSKIKVNGELVGYNIADTVGKAYRLKKTDVEGLCSVYGIANGKLNCGVISAIQGEYDVEEIDDSKQLRIEKAKLFVEKIQMSIIDVIGHEVPSPNCSPTNYILSANGVVGDIGIHPGTEWFNKKILEALKFKGVVAGDCRHINPSYGNIEKYIGWVTAGNLRQCSNIYNMSAFTISNISSYSNEADILKQRNEYYNKNYLYTVRIKELRACAFVKSDGKVGLVTLSK